MHAEKNSQEAKKSDVSEEVDCFIKEFGTFIKGAIEFARERALFYEGKHPGVTALSDTLDASVTFLEHPSVETYSMLREKSALADRMASKARDEGGLIYVTEGRTTAWSAKRAEERAIYAVSNASFVVPEVIGIENGKVVVYDWVKEVETFSRRGQGVGVIPFVAERLRVVKDMVEESKKHEKSAAIGKRA